MRKTKIWILLIGLMAWLANLSAQDNSRHKYIKEYRKIAIQEMERSGVPASIKLAQGILESNAGKSTLAKKAKNHFGMKCGSEAQWTGDTYYLEDDDYNDAGKLIKSCFRVYKKAKDSYIAHSEFLRDPRKRYRYGFLFSLNPRDYKAWAKGLKSSGYATSPTYAEKLIGIIETYELYQYDKEGAPEVETPDNIDFEDVDDVIVEDVDDSGIKILNDVKMVLAEKDDSPLEIANRTGVNVKCILKFNDRLTSATEDITPNTRVYLQKKRNGYRGKQKWHQVREGETLYYISQAYGIKISKLKKRNRIGDNQEPKSGQLLKLRGWKVSKKRAPKTIRASNIKEKEFIETSDEPVVVNKETPPDTSPEVPEVEDEEEEDEIQFDPAEEIDLEETFNPFDEDLPQEKPVYHRVIKGETLYGIARFYGVIVEQVRELNKLESNYISPGQTLRIK